MVSIKSTSVSENFSIVLPSGIVSGDLILILAAQYNNSIPTPSGYTVIKSDTVSSVYTEHASAFYKLATGSEGGTTLTLSNWSQISGLICLVITGHDQTTPIVASGSNKFAGNTVSTGDTLPTPTSNVRMFYLWGIMSDTQVSPTLSVVSSGRTEIVEVADGPSYAWHTTMAAASDTIISTGGSYGAIAQSSSNGAFVGIGIAVKQGNAAPVPTNMSPANNTATGNSLGNVVFSWTPVDAESNPQSGWQINYRELGATSWINYTGTTSTSFTLNGVLTDGKEYEWRIRLKDAITDAYGEWVSVASFTAGNNLWTYGTETNSSVESASISGLTSPGEYQVQVRTADAEGFGPWSSTSLFTILPPSKTYSFDGTSWSIKLNNTFNGSAFSQSKPTSTKLYNMEVLADNPVAYWPLDNVSEPVIDRVSGNNGSGVNTPTYNIDGVVQYRKSARFARNAQERISLPNSVLPSGNSAFTIEAWIKPSILDNLQGIVGWGNFGTTNQVNALRLSSTGVVHYFWGNDLSVNATISTTSWTHLVVTYNGTTRTIYINGSSAISANPTSTPAVVAANGNIGALLASTPEYFTGDIADVAIYNYALSAARVQAHYSAMV